jgi:hypothetical protein
MVRVCILPVVFLLSNTLLLAQQQLTKQNVDSGTLSRTRSAAINCPVGVEASFGSGGTSVLRAGPSINGNPIGQGTEGQAKPPVKAGTLLHLDVSNPSSRDIVNAKFTAHGFSRKLRVFNPSDASNAPDLAKTLDVALDVQGNGHASSDLSLTNFTAIITSIDLDSITYADGSTWRASAPGICSIVPSRVMRIASVR